MARGVADVLEIVVLAACTQATLHVGGTHVAALVDAEEDILELHHAAVGEQQRRDRWPGSSEADGTMVCPFDAK